MALVTTKREPFISILCDQGRGVGASRLHALFCLPVRFSRSLSVPFAHHSEDASQSISIDASLPSFPLNRRHSGKITHLASLVCDAPGM